MKKLLSLILIICIATSMFTGRVYAKKLVGPQKPTIKTVENTGKGKIRVVVKKMKKVSGYRVFCSSTNKFKPKKTQKITSKKNKVVFKGLQSGRYFIKAKAYNIGKGGKRKYSKASKTFKIKIKGITETDQDNDPDIIVVPNTTGDFTGPNFLTKQKYRLMVNGVDLTAAGHYTRYVIEYRWAEIPLIPVLEAIGAKFEWKDDNMANVFLNEEEYVFNIAEKTLVNVKSKQSVLFRSPGAYFPFCEVIDGQFILDSNAVEWFLGENGYGITIDTESLIVTIDPLPEELMPRKFNLIVNGVDLSEQGYYAVRYPIANDEDIPFIPTLKALGAKVLQEDDKLVTIDFYGEEYIFDKENFLFGKVDSELQCFLVAPGGFLHKQFIDGIFYLDLMTFWSTFFIKYNIKIEKERNLDAGQIIINTSDHVYSNI